MMENEPALVKEQKEETAKKGSTGSACIFAGVEVISADVVDLQAVADKLKEDKNVTVNIQDYLCSSVGQDKIKNDIEKGKVDRVVIGSCSPKLHLETFRGMAKNCRT